MLCRNNTDFLPVAYVLGLQPGIPLEVPIVVVAEDSVTSLRYYLQITRAQPADNDTSDLAGMCQLSQMVYPHSHAESADHGQLCGLRCLLHTRNLRSAAISHNPSLFCRAPVWTRGCSRESPDRAVGVDDLIDIQRRQRGGAPAAVAHGDDRARSALVINPIFIAFLSAARVSWQQRQGLGMMACAWAVMVPPPPPPPAL